MFPNQRRAMLVSSPGLVIYAELLLLAQYVFSFNLTNEELPQTVDGVDLGEIGLVKSRTLACLPILVKVSYKKRKLCGEIMRSGHSHSIRECSGSLCANL